MVVLCRGDNRAAEITSRGRESEGVEARYVLINHLAHELNNPLAAMTFTLHLLTTTPFNRRHPEAGS